MGQNCHKALLLSTVVPAVYATYLGVKRPQVQVLSLGPTNDNPNTLFRQVMCSDLSFLLRMYSNSQEQERKFLSLFFFMSHAIIYAGKPLYNNNEPKTSIYCN